MSKVLEQIQLSKARIAKQPLPPSDGFQPALLLSKLKAVSSEVVVPELKNYLETWEMFLKNKDERALDKRTLGVLSFDPSVSLSTTYLEVVERQKSISNRLFKGLLYSLQKTYGSKRGCTKIMLRIFEKLDIRYRYTAPFMYCRELLDNRLADTLGRQLLKNTADLRDVFNSKGLVVNSPVANASLLFAAKQLAQQKFKTEKDKTEKEVSKSFRDLLSFKPKDKELLNSLLNIAIPRLLAEKNDEANRMLQYILTHEQYGDPRINSSKWTGIEEEARKLAYSYLSTGDIEFFFDVVCKGKDSHRRKRFWLNYTGRMVKSFVFVSNYQLTNECELLAKAKKEHGRVFGRTCKGDISVFVMDLGKLVAVEFSDEDNACYVYQRRDFPDVLPNFFSPEIDTVEQLQELDFTVVDSKIGNGHWQPHREGWQRHLGLYLGFHGITPNFLDRP